MIPDVFLNHSPPYPFYLLRKRVSLDLELTNSALGAACLDLPSPVITKLVAPSGLYLGAGIQTQVLVAVQQALHSQAMSPTCSHP